MINRLRVTNFKSLHELDLVLGSLTVLIGPNQAGPVDDGGNSVWEHTKGTVEIKALFFPG